MKKLLSFVLLSSTLYLSGSYARTVEVDVYGMTCSFCVNSLERKFNKMDSVSKVEVSLKLKKVRLETDERLPSIETIKQAILDTGFTPTKVMIVSNKK